MEGRSRKIFRVVLATLSVATVVLAALVLDGVIGDDMGSRFGGFFGASSKTPLTVTITCQERYTRCGDFVKNTIEVSKADLEDTVASLSGWTVVESTELGVVLQKDIEGFCSDHENYRFIALYRGSPTEPPHVFIFRGKKVDPAFIVRERKDLTEERLYPQDKAKLQQGILVTLEPADPSDLNLDAKATAYLQGIAEGR